MKYDAIKIENVCLKNVTRHEHESLIKKSVSSVWAAACKPGFIVPVYTRGITSKLKIMLKQCKVVYHITCSCNTKIMDLQQSAHFLYIIYIYSERQTLPFGMKIQILFEFMSV